MEQREPNKQYDMQGDQGQKPRSQSGSAYLSKKSEKLTTALYMVTDIMSDKEPLRWKLRESGVDLLSDITVSGSASASERMSVLRAAMKKIDRIVALLDIAETARMLTQMNTSVLKKEYLGLKGAVENEWSTIYEQSKNIFSETFFDVARANEPALPSGKAAEAAVSRNEASTTDRPSATQVEEKKFTSPPEPARPMVVAQPPPAPIAKPQPAMKHPSVVLPPVVTPPSQTPEHSRESARPRNDVPQVSRPFIQAFRQYANATEERGHDLGRARNDGDKNERRTIILALIKQKPSLTVQDVAKSIPAVSEKTIQRELLAMVAEGTLIKRGERRWSTYSLRQN